MRRSPTTKRLSHRDLDACASVLPRLYEPCPLSRFPERLLPLLSELVPVEHSSYQEFYRHLATGHQMIFFLRNNLSQRVGLAFNRAQRDFSERDRSVMAFLSPHIARAYNNARMSAVFPEQLERLGEGLDAMRRAVILADAQGGMSWRSDLAREWMAEFFPDYVDSSKMLPLTLKNWVERSGRAAAADRPNFSEMQTTSANGCRLLVYCGKNGNGSTVIALVRERQMIEVDKTNSLGLTGREAQILFWISEAKTNPQIAAILDLSPRTIHKHTEHIFAKLGLENRLEAQRLAWELRRI